MYKCSPDIVTCLLCIEAAKLLTDSPPRHIGFLKVAQTAHVSLSLANRNGYKAVGSSFSLALQSNVNLCLLNGLLPVSSVF